MAAASKGAGDENQTVKTIKLTDAQRSALDAVRMGDQTVDGRTLRALRNRKLVKGTRTVQITAAGERLLKG